MNVFAPDSVVVPVPALLKAPSPEITPENVVLALANPPAVNVTPDATSITPAPDIEPISSVASTSYAVSYTHLTLPTKRIV